MVLFIVNILIYYLYNKEYELQYFNKLPTLTWENGSGIHL